MLKLDIPNNIFEQMIQHAQAQMPIEGCGILAGKDGRIEKFYGQLITVLPGKTACYRCIFNAPPPAGVVPSCSQAGVLGVLAGVIGTLQATEVIKYLLGLGKLLTGTLLTYDALEMDFRTVKLSRNTNCPLCGENPEITELKDEEQQVCDLKNCKC